MHKNNNIKGFTLVELLVVIAIIGLLSTFAVVSLNEARLKARDARRLADVKQMMTALEIYYSSCGRYPSAVVPGGRVAGGDPIDCPMNTNIYLGVIFITPVYFAIFLKNNNVFELNKIAAFKILVYCFYFYHL